MPAIDAAQSSFRFGTPDFKLDLADPPPVVAPAIQELRRYARELLNFFDHMAAAADKIEKSMDYTPEARLRKLTEAHAEHFAPVETQMRKAIAAATKARESIAGYVASSGTPPDFAVPLQKLTDPAQHGLAERVERLVRADARREIAATVDRALAAEDPVTAALAALEAVVGVGDPILEAAFTTHGVAQLKAKKPNVALIVEQRIEEIRQARIPKDAIYLRDCSRWIEQAGEFAMAVTIEAARRYRGGKTNEPRLLVELLGDVARF